MKKALVVVLSMVFSPLILGMMTPFLIGMAEGLIFLFILFICRKIEKYILVFIGIDKENRELLRNLSAAQEDWRRRKARMYVTRELGGHYLQPK